MLVIRRKPGEGIVLNGVIVIRVLAVEGERVKLGVHAPSDVVIVRQEQKDDVSYEYHRASNSRQSARLAPRPPAQGTSAHRRDMQTPLDGEYS